MMEESLLRLLWHRLRGVFSKRRRNRTPHEVTLEDQVADLRRQLQDHRAQLEASLQQSLELRSRLRVSQVEVEALAEVVTRDRKRIEAETASYARKVADATTFERQ